MATAASLEVHELVSEGGKPLGWQEPAVNQDDAVVTSAGAQGPHAGGEVDEREVDVGSFAQFSPWSPPRHVHKLRRRCDAQEPGHLRPGSSWNRIYLVFLDTIARFIPGVITIDERLVTRSRFTAVVTFSLVAGVWVRSLFMVSSRQGQVDCNSHQSVTRRRSTNATET